MVYILIDSSADINITEKENFKFVPITVSINGKDYKAGEDLDNDTFYTLLTQSKEFPKTAQPSPESFVTVFEQIKAAGDSIVCLALSAGLSGTYQSAVIAKQMVDYDEIYIVDTLSVTAGIRILSDVAEKMRAEGKSAAQIASECERLKTKIRIAAGVDTLEYLCKGGRLSRTSAAVGTMANIKPVIYVNEEGKVAVLSKSLGKARAYQSILQFCKDNPVDPDYPAYSVYTMGEENTAQLEEKLASAGIGNFSRIQIGSTIGAHVGPGAYGFIYITK